MHAAKRHHRVVVARSKPNIKTVVNADGREVLTPSKQALSSLVSLFPTHLRKDLPFDETNGFFVLSPQMLMSSLALASAMVSSSRESLTTLTLYIQDGPRCVQCITSGEACHVVGFPLECEACRKKKTNSSCSLSLSDEILDVMAIEFARYVDQSSEGKSG